jgi:hypothetical protein
MIDLETYGQGNRTQGVFPNVAAIDSNGENNDGTPLMAALVDDIWGFYQSCMNECGYTPSGDNENSSESQILQALKNICGGPGEIVLYAGNASRLAFSDKRLLPLAGGIYLVAQYQDLIDEVFDGSENATTEGFYRCSDQYGTVRDTLGSYFHVPDYRGYFIRGYDQYSLHDPDNRDIHSLQLDKIKEHQHYIQSPALSNEFYARAGDGTVGSGSDKVLYFYNSTSNRAEAGETPSVQTATETRPRNRNAYICVRY